MNFLSGAACFRLSTLRWCLNCSGNSSTSIPKDPSIIICCSIHPCRRRQWRRRQEIDSSTTDARMQMNLNPVEAKTDRQRRQKRSQRGQRQKSGGREGTWICCSIHPPVQEIHSSTKILRAPMNLNPVEAKKMTWDWFYLKDWEKTHGSGSSGGKEEDR